MYEKYYSKKSEMIFEGLCSLKRAGNRIAIWSAGNRGEVFLKIYDPANKYIDCVFDMNTDLSGQYMKSGHRIMDYRNTSVDIVIFVDPVYEIDSVVRLKKSGSRAQICCLDDVLYGNIPFEKSLDLYVGDVPLISVRKAKIASLTIVYNMDMDEVVRNIKTYAGQVDCAYVFDNSPTSHQCVFDGISSSYHIRYIHGDGKNQGIGFPINRVAETIIKEGYEWLITFDQDSRALPNTIDEMRKYVESSFYDESVALVTPNIWGGLEPLTRECIKEMPYLTYKYEIIQSGAMHRMDVWTQVGGYSEELFIDFVDFEYSFRVRNAGYAIVYLNRIYLAHQTKDDFKGFFSKSAGYIMKGKYSLKRYYYHFRNCHYCAINFGYQDPVFAEECKVYRELNIRKMHHEFSEKTIERILNLAEKDAEEGKMGEAVFNFCLMSE